MSVAFSVILPVRNGWPYVKECVESILAQTYTNFELIVMDNCSTDQTLAYLTSIADERLRVMTSLISLSIEESWARAKTVKKLDFVTLIGHDDRFDPGFLATIAALIDREPAAALYQTGARLINSDGTTIRSCHPVPSCETASDYLRARLTYKRDVFGTGYVMRSADYDRLGGIPAFQKLFFADDALWLSLIRDGCKIAGPQERFSVRIHPNSESASLPSAWSSILAALNQFWAFLRQYGESDAEARAVIAEHAPDFMLTYHRNIYIFALVEACEARRKISPDVRRQIENSLHTMVPSMAGSLRASLKVRGVESLAASPLRTAVPLLWRAYYRLRTRS